MLRVRLLLLMFIVIGVIAFAEGATQEVVVEGIGAIVDGNIAKAKDEAEEDAKRKAVEKAVGLLIASETTVKNGALAEDNIYTETNGYVDTYQVTKETKDEFLYYTTMKAVVKTVSIGDIGNKLLFRGFIKKLGDPRIMVVIPEYYRGNKMGSSTAETLITGQLVEAGYKVVDQNQVKEIRDSEKLRKAAEGDILAATEIATQFGADILISGQVNGDAIPVILNDKDTGLISFTGVLNIKAIKADNGEIILTETQNIKKPGISAEQAEKLAVTDAVKKLCEEALMFKIGKTLFQRPSVQLTFTGINSDQYTQIIKILNGERTIGGISRKFKIFPREFNGNVGRIDIDYDKNPEKLKELLEGIKEIKMNVNGYTRNKMDVKVIQPLIIEIQSELKFDEFKGIVERFEKMKDVLVISKKFSQKISTVELTNKGDTYSLADKLSDKFDVVDINDAKIILKRK